MVYLFIADGFEEVEAMAPIDLLRRAGQELCVVGVTGKVVMGSHGVPVTADCLTDAVELDKMSMMILPGGMKGTSNLASSEFVEKAIRYCVSNKRYIAAICAAPSVVLGPLGVLEGKQATCYPGMEDGMKGAKPKNKDYCIDDKIITGRAAGAAIDFSLALCEVLAGRETSERVREEIHYGV